MHILIFTIDRQNGEFFKTALLQKKVTSSVVQLTPSFTFQPGFYRYDIFLFLLGPYGEGFCALEEVYKEAYHYPFFVIINEMHRELEQKFSAVHLRRVFTKPYDFDEIAYTFQEVMTSKYLLARAKELRVKDLVLDLDRQTLVMGKDTLSLRHKEFELMRLFMTNPDRVISRTELLERIWDHQINTLTNTVEVHIANLRRKLRFNGTHKLIRTVPCVGYQLMTENKIKNRQ